MLLKKEVGQNILLQALTVTCCLSLGILTNVCPFLFMSRNADNVTIKPQNVAGE